VDPSADGRRSAAIFPASNCHRRGGGISSRGPRGDTLFCFILIAFSCCHHVCDEMKLCAAAGGRALFGAFLRSEFSDENLEFWLQCERYRTASYCSDDELRDTARQIYQDFVAPNAPRQVCPGFTVLIEYSVASTAEQLEPTSRGSIPIPFSFVLRRSLSLPPNYCFAPVPPFPFPVFFLSPRIQL